MIKSMAMFWRAAFLGALICAAEVIAATALAANEKQQNRYAGQHNRPIKALSAADVEALRNGQGWGLARPAELNGYPGPLHVLELVDELNLSEEQVTQVQAVFERMRESAVAAGEAYLEAEQKLDDAFANAAATPELVDRLTQQAGRARALLRAVHLNAHLETRPLLHDHQRQLYAQLRGYGVGSPQHRGGHRHRH